MASYISKLIGSGITIILHTGDPYYICNKVGIEELANIFGDQEFVKAGYVNIETEEIVTLDQGSCWLSLLKHDPSDL